jgi:hypothetical protein
MFVSIFHVRCLSPCCLYPCPCPCVCALVRLHVSLSVFVTLTMSMFIIIPMIMHPCCRLNTVGPLVKSRMETDFRTVFRGHCCYGTISVPWYVGLFPPALFRNEAFMLPKPGFAQFLLPHSQSMLFSQFSSP